MRTSVFSCHFLKSLVIGACVGSALACGSDVLPTAPESAAIEARAARSGASAAKVTRQVVFRFGMRGTSSEDFVAVTSDETVIQKARRQLQLPEASRSLFISGYITEATKRANLGWNWQFVDSNWNLVEVSFGTCDGRPSAVDANLGSWLAQGAQFCPVASYVKSESSRPAR